MIKMSRSIKLKCMECNYSGFAPEEQDGYELRVYVGHCPKCGCDDVYMVVEREGIYTLVKDKYEET